MSLKHTSGKRVVMPKKSLLLDSKRTGWVNSPVDFLGPGSRFVVERSGPGLNRTGTLWIGPNSHVFGSDDFNFYRP